MGVMLEHGAGLKSAKPVFVGAVWKQFNDSCREVGFCSKHSVDSMETMLLQSVAQLPDDPDWGSMQACQHLRVYQRLRRAQEQSLPVPVSIIRQQDFDFLELKVTATFDQTWGLVSRAADPGYCFTCGTSRRCGHRRVASASPQALEVRKSLQVVVLKCAPDSPVFNYIQ